MSQLLTFANILQNMQIPEDINPLIIKLPDPPILQGALEPNNWLSKVQIHANDKVLGPESMVVYRGYVYTGQADGWVVEISPMGNVRKIARLSLNTCGQPNAGEDACGRPMGIRLDNKGYLVVADAYGGIIRVNPRTGELKQLVDARTLRVNGQPLGYINDLTIAKDDSIFFTSSSTKWTYTKESNILFEAENTGRVLMYHPERKEVKEVVTKLTFPNGLQLSEDGSYLLIGEGTRSRILRAWIGSNSTKMGTMELFADNLPGVVDNIRLSPRGTYWVGISQSRHRHLPNVLDKFGDRTKLRAALIMLVNNRVKFDNPKFGIVLELDADGKILRSLQDPLGWRYTSVSEVEEESGLLYFASPGKRFIGYMKLSALNGSETELPVSYHPAVMEFLRKTSFNLQRMEDGRVKEVVVELIQQILRVKQQTIAFNQLSRQRVRRIQVLQQMLNNRRESKTTTPPSGGSSTTSTTSGVTTPLVTTTTALPTSSSGEVTSTSSPAPETTTTAASTTTTTTAALTTTTPVVTSTGRITTTVEAATTTLAE